MASTTRSRANKPAPDPSGFSPWCLPSGLYEKWDGSWTEDQGNAIDAAHALSLSRWPPDRWQPGAIRCGVGYMVVARACHPDAIAELAERANDAQRALIRTQDKLLISDPIPTLLGLTSWRRTPGPIRIIVGRTATYQLDAMSAQCDCQGFTKAMQAGVDDRWLCRHLAAWVEGHTIRMTPSQEAEELAKLIGGEWGEEQTFALPTIQDLTRRLGPD